MAIHIGDVIELCQVEAIANKLGPTPASIWRNFCRTYSKLFHTPYHEVLEMDPEMVILAVTEESFERVDVIEQVNELMDRVYSIEDPNYEASKEHELKDFIKQAEEEEAERIKSGKGIFIPRKKKKAQAEAALPKAPPKELPKGGYVNLSYLAKEEEES